MGLLKYLGLGLIILLTVAGFVVADVVAEYDGVVLSLKGDVDAAMADLEERPGSVMIALGNAAATKGNNELAAKFFTKATDDSVEGAVALHNLGVLAYWDGNVGQAEIYLRQAVTADPDYARGQYSLAILLFEEGRITESVEPFRAYAALSDDPHGHFDLGVALVESHRQEGADAAQLVEAKEAFDRTVALDADFPHAANNAAIVGNVLAELS